MANAVEQRWWVRQGWDSFWELKPEGETARFGVTVAIGSFLLAKRVFTAANPWTAAAVMGTICLVSESVFNRMYTNSQQRPQDVYFMGGCRYIVTVGLQLAAASAWMSSIQAVAFVAIANVSANFVRSVVEVCLSGYQILIMKATDDKAAAAGDNAVNNAESGDAAGIDADTAVSGSDHSAGLEDGDLSDDEGSGSGMGSPSGVSGSTHRKKRR